MNNKQSFNSNGRRLSKNFGLGIKYYREKKGLSLQQLYEISGISSSYINRIELGERLNPSLTVIQKIASALGVPLEELIDLSYVDKDLNVPTIAQLLLQNDFLINDEVINVKAKGLLIEINEAITDYIWADKEKNREIFELITLVEEFKDAM